MKNHEILEKNVGLLAIFMVIATEKIGQLGVADNLTSLLTVLKALP